MLKRAACLVTVAVTVMCSGPACSGSGELGEACDVRGATDECIEGTICSEEETAGVKAVRCLQVCEDQNDCDANASCNGVSGSNIKSCQAKSD